MTTVHYRGFAGVRLEADVAGADNDPAVLLVHGAGQNRTIWTTVAAALEQAGRRVISLDLRGHGGSEGRADSGHSDAAGVGPMAEDLRAVLAQLGSRPVVIAATTGGTIALAALDRDAALLAAGLVLVDLPIDGGWAASGLRGGAAPSDTITLPTLHVRGAMGDLLSHAAVAAFAARFPGGELVEIENRSGGIPGDCADALSAHIIDFLERRAPREWPEYRAGSDARTFRDALGCFATGVTVVTAMGAGEAPIGLTANSFTSVSLDPPLLLVCIANSAGSAAVLRAADRFAVNVLQIGQQPTSNRFAGHDGDRFVATPWEIGEFGTPVLTGSLGSFECAREAIHPGGDHFILVGRVLKAIFEPRRDPLLYFRGKYRKLHFA